MSIEELFSNQNPAGKIVLGGLTVLEAVVALGLAVIGASVTGLIWAVRLEGRVNLVEKDNVGTQKQVDELRVKHEALDSKIVQELMTMRESLAEIKGLLRGQEKRDAQA